MEIREIKANIRDIQIRFNEINIAEIRPWELNSPVVNNLNLPLTDSIGRPIVDMPGCVEARESENDQLFIDDPKGNLTLCDGGLPYFRPLVFEPEVVLPTPKAKADTRQKPAQPNTENIIKDTVPPPAPPNNAEVTVECPTQELLDEQPVGLIFDSGRKEVTGYRLEGKQCIVETKDVRIIEQAINALPPTETVVTTAAIAVVATTSALLAKPFADILLRVIKPVTKKVIKKIATIRGKTPKVESVSERREAQRDRVNAIQTLRKALKK